MRNVNSEDRTTHPKLSQTRRPGKGEPGRSTCRSRSPARPAAARRGRTQRRPDACSPRFAPPRGAKGPPKGPERRPREQQDLGAPICTRGARKGHPARTGKGEGNLTSQPRPARWGGQDVPLGSPRARRLESGRLRRKGAQTFPLAGEIGLKRNTKSNPSGRGSLAV